MAHQGTWVWGRAQCRHGCPTEHPPPATTRTQAGVSSTQCLEKALPRYGSLDFYFLYPNPTTVYHHRYVYTVNCQTRRGQNNWFVFWRTFALWTCFSLIAPRSPTLMVGWFGLPISDSLPFTQQMVNCLHSLYINFMSSAQKVTSCLWSPNLGRWSFPIGASIFCQRWCQREGWDSFTSFPSWHQSLQLGQFFWFCICVGVCLYVCRFTCIYANIHVEARVNLRLYSSGTIHLAFETGSLCGRRGLQTRRGWLGRKSQRPTCLHLPSTEGAPTSGLFCIGPYFTKKLQSLRLPSKHFTESSSQPTALIQVLRQ